MVGFIPRSWAPWLLSVLRIVVAVLFIAHGTQKLFGAPVLKPQETAALTSQRGVAGVLEVFGGSLILLGFLTRPVAFILSGEMAFAYFLSHWPRNFWPILNGGEPAVLFCFIFLYFAATGPGPWSVDAMRRAE